jgi:hypothetical protein
MFFTVNRRFLRKIALVLVAAQILGAPVANAFAATAATAPTAAAAHCADGTPAADHGDQCPCCPDGSMNVSACLSACTVSVGWVPVLAVATAPAVSERVASVAPARPAARAEPPLKPPPIA